VLQVCQKSNSLGACVKSKLFCRCGQAKRDHYCPVPSGGKSISTAAFNSRVGAGAIFGNVANQPASFGFLKLASMPFVGNPYFSKVRLGSSSSSSNRSCNSSDGVPISQPPSAAPPVPTRPNTISYVKVDRPAVDLIRFSPNTMSLAQKNMLAASLLSASPSSSSSSAGTAAAALSAVTPPDCVIDLTSSGDDDSSPTDPEHVSPVAN
jgi:hypothetical protein